jgi:hypothetical protein
MKAILLSAFFACLCCQGLAQNISVQDINSLRDDFRMEKNRSKTINPAYQSIQGSPYLKEGFTVGEIMLGDSILFEKIPMRYNIYTGKMEALNTDSVVIELDISNRAYIFHLGNSLFTVSNFTDNGQTWRGILELLADGEIKLYKRCQVVLKPATKASGYSPAEPDRFIRLDDKYLTAFGQEQPETFRNAKELMERLKTIKPDMEQYAKNRKLKLKSENGLIQLVQYCNQN